MSVSFNVESLPTGEFQFSQWLLEYCCDEIARSDKRFPTWEAATEAADAHREAVRDDWEHADGCHDLRAQECMDVDLSVNYANSNARAVLDMLGINSEDLCGSMDGGEFLAACQIALATASPVLHARPVESGTGAGGAQWFDCGLSEADLIERVERLADLATEAHRLGRAITWG